MYVCKWTEMTLAVTETTQFQGCAINETVCLYAKLIVDYKMFLPKCNPLSRSCYTF